MVFALLRSQPGFLLGQQIELNNVYAWTCLSMRHQKSKLHRQSVRSTSCINRMVGTVMGLFWQKTWLLPPYMASQFCVNYTLTSCNITCMLGFNGIVMYVPWGTPHGLTRALTDTCWDLSYSPWAMTKTFGSICRLVTVSGVYCAKCGSHYESK